MTASSSFSSDPRWQARASPDCAAQRDIDPTPRSTEPMKQGYRIIDTDTHVGPNLETLGEYAGPKLRERWHELDEYWMPVTDGGHHLSISPFPYKRRLRQSTVLDAEAPRAGL